jgi:hypothetical protein
MVYDDDTGRRVHFGIWTEDEPFTSIAPSMLPTDRVRTKILTLAQRHPRWDEERIRARLGPDGDDVAPETIRYLIYEARAKQQY